MEAQQLLVKIDNDNIRTFGNICIFPIGGSNAYINELEHRRWMHPEYPKYLELKRNPPKEEKNETTQDGSNKIQETK